MNGDKAKVNGSANARVFENLKKVKINGSANACKFVGCKKVTINGSANNSKFASCKKVTINGSANNCQFMDMDREKIKILGSINNCTLDGVILKTEAQSQGTSIQTFGTSSSIQIHGDAVVNGVRLTTGTYIRKGGKFYKKENGDWVPINQPICSNCNATLAKYKCADCASQFCGDFCAKKHFH